LVYARKGEQELHAAWSRDEHRDKLGERAKLEDVVPQAALSIRSSLPKIKSVYLLGLPQFAVLIMAWRAQGE
jgi:hypothetical protein